MAKSNKPAKTKEAVTPTRSSKSKTSIFRKKEFRQSNYKLPSAWNIAKESLRLIWQNKKLFGGILLINGILSLLLVQGLASSSNISNIKDQITLANNSNPNSLTTGFAVFLNVIGSNSSSSASGGAYQFFLGVISSLAIIWGLRQVSAGLIVRVRDAFYRGMYPLIPFIIIIIVIVLQLIPLLIGAYIYSLVMTNGLAVLGIEKLAWLLLFAALSSISIYLICSSLFAMYIVTLPDMTPLKSLRSARNLVRGRRWIVIRKLLFLPLYLLLFSAIIMIPAITWFPVIAQWLFYILGLVVLLLTHSYLYSTYRELLNE